MKRNLNFDALEDKQLLSISITPLAPVYDISPIQPPPDPVSDYIITHSTLTVTFPDQETVIIPTRPVVPVQVVPVPHWVNP